MTLDTDVAPTVDTPSKPKRLSATLHIHQDGGDIELELILTEIDKTCDANMLAAGTAMSFQNVDYREKIIRRMHTLLRKT